MDVVTVSRSGSRGAVLGHPGQFFKAGATRPFPVIYEDPPFTIYENRGATPRAYLVYEAESVASPEQALKRLADPLFNVDRSVVLERPPQTRSHQPAPAGRTPWAAILSYQPHTVEIETEADGPAYLVLTDQYYSGWEAAVDGQPATIFRANYLFRAVDVPEGKHRVVFRFVRRSFPYLGLLVAAGAVSLVAVTATAVWWSRTRSARVSQDEPA